MTKEEFIRYMENIKGYVEKEHAIDDALRALSPDFGGFCLGDILDDLVKLLAKCVGDKYENLDYYIWEYDFGASALADSVSDDDGPIPFRTPEDVYNCIMKECADDKKSDDNVIGYLIGEVKKYKKLYENEKDHSETLQRIIDKTMDAIVDEAIPEEIRETQKKTTTCNFDFDFSDLEDLINNHLLKELKGNE